jgi:hypothetical protein
MPADLHVTGILPSRGFAEVYETVIIGIKVTMIYVTFRPNALCEKPRQPMGRESSSVDIDPASAFD